MNKNIIVLFIWDVDEILKKHLKKSLKCLSNVKLIFPKELDEKVIFKLGVDADIIIGWRPSLELLRGSKKLKLFINPGTGIKHHIENFRKINKTKKTILVNGHGHAYSTAQHAVAMLLSLMNRIVSHHNWMKDGIWRTSDDKDIFSASIQLRNRNIGLLGYGAINQYVHKFLSGFENNFHILKRNLEVGISPACRSVGTGRDSGFNDNKVYFYIENDLNKFLKAIDILIVAVPHTSKTEKLIGKKELKLFGKNALVVNVARGSIIDEKNLYESLKNSSIAGAALDVWYNYNPKKDKDGKQYPYKFPFHKLDNVILSPHRAASPFDDLTRWDEVIENIIRFAKGRKDFLNVVDLEREY